MHGSLSPKLKKLEDSLLEPLTSEPADEESQDEIQLSPGHQELYQTSWGSYGVLSILGFPRDI